MVPASRLFEMRSIDGRLAVNFIEKGIFSFLAAEVVL